MEPQRHCRDDGSMCAVHRAMYDRPPAPSNTVEDEYTDGSPPTSPRLDAASDCRRAWPVAEDCSSDARPRNSLEAIAAKCDELKSFLIGKNAAYGNSAFEPINIFSKLSAREGLLLRLDDKLKRIRNGHAYPGDDNTKDAAGYLILLLVLDDMK